MKVCPGIRKTMTTNGVHPVSNRRELMSSDQTCVQCGRCCEKWGWGQKGVIEDLIPWLRENRLDILQHVSIMLANKRRCSASSISEKDLPDIIRIDYWTDPCGRALTSCPFFRRADDGKVFCRIHTAKPKVCIGFTPWNEGIRDYALNCPACRNSAP
jgi:Fe-S-cluster containining protein